MLYFNTEFKDIFIPLKIIFNFKAILITTTTFLIVFNCFKEKKFTLSKLTQHNFLIQQIQNSIGKLKIHSVINVHNQIILLLSLILIYKK